MHAIESLNRLTRARGVLDAELGRDPRPEDRNRWVMKVQAGIVRNGLRTIPRSVGLAARRGVPITKIQLLLDEAKYPASFEALVGGSEERPSTRCARHAARVKTRLLADPAVSGLQIDVDTRDRIVTLDRRRKRDTEKARAVELASNIENVIRVEDRSTVRPRIP